MPRYYTIALAVFSGLLIFAFLGILAYDSSTANTVTAGVKVANVDVGGLERAEAEQRVRDKIVAKLQTPLTIPVADREYHLGARESQIKADVAATVDAAIEQGREGGMFARAWRGLTGGERKAVVTPKVTYSSAAVDRLVERVQRALDRTPVDAKVDFTPDQVTIRRSRTGQTVDAKRLRANVLAELTSATGDRIVEVPVETERPKVSTRRLASRYPTVLTLDRGAFRLTLFKKLKRVRTYSVAVGQSGLETPAGLYKIQNKAVNPAWTVPNSPWAGSLAGRVFPGGAPDNPLKSRWLGVYDGVGLHGTADRGSIGSNASHGCIRMLVEDIEVLYDDVPVGTPIYIG